MPPAARAAATAAVTSGTRKWTYQRGRTSGSGACSTAPPWTTASLRPASLTMTSSFSYSTEQLLSGDAQPKTSP